ncbi:RNA polymerase sigma factor [Sphingomonas sp. MMS12-HWE2-04]|uniref:RNA polymerase sigma factor n=1 Tax=Sphingomonas sp. MMS12-HWE2-04 TaxID=3234199 RepID=UPI00384B6F88
MTRSSQPIACAFRVDVEFQSGEVTFAAESYTLLAIDSFDAERLARARAEDSAYYNVLIPNLDVRVKVATGDPPDPDGDPPPSASGRLGATCPRCLSNDVVREAWAHWDETRQCWSLGGLYDLETCQNCGAEGDALSLWLSLPSDLSTECGTALVDIEAYRAAVAAMPDLIGRAFRLHSAEGLSYAEVAECLAISIADVERLLAQALATLVRHFSDSTR